MVLIWQSGTCLLQVPRLVTFTVTANPDDDSQFALSIDGGAEIEGTVVLDQCILSFSITEPDGIGLGFLGTARSDYNISERNNDLEGSGMITVGSPENCGQIFSVEGNKEDPE